MAETDSGGREDRVQKVLKARQDEIFDSVSRSVAALLDVDATALSPETVMLDLGAQSLDFVDLVFRLQRAFGIAMPRELAVTDMQTLQVFVEGVASGLADRETSEEQIAEPKTTILSKQD